MWFSAIAISLRLLSSYWTDSGGDLFDSRRFPRPIDDRGRFFVRPIHAQHQDELACGSGQPVGFLVGAGRVFLDVEVDRAVRVRFQVLPRADRIAVDRIATKKYFSLYMVIDQKPCTGGNCPFGKCITYLLVPS